MLFLLPWRLWSCGGAVLVDLVDRPHSLQQPGQHGYCHAVPDGSVAWSIRSRFAAIGDVREVVRQSLKSLAFSVIAGSGDEPR